MAAINYFYEDISFSLPNPRKRSLWIKKAIAGEGFSLKNLNYIFCSDEHLLSINREYLQHDTYTDIVTFDNSDTEDIVEADIFISVDRVAENAGDRNISFEDELDRVLIHGVLHLVGYDDKSPAEARLMREKEEAYLSLR